jgi:NAD(P)-dependent dehydrogenase (short-subunit alcohol dehydrogenase family)
MALDGKTALITGSSRRIGRGIALALLCSEKARWITGQVIYADGGASLMNPEVPPEIQIG